MTDCYEGVRYRVTAHYGKLADRQVEITDSRSKADRIVRRHFKAGANVELVQLKWVEQRSDLAFYDHRLSKARP